MPRTNQDELKFEILEDGTIRTTSDKISGANHATADAILSAVAKLAGGDVKIERRGTGHSHTHTHAEKKERR